MLGTTPLGFARSWPSRRSRGSGDSTLTRDLPPQGHTEWIEDFFHVTQVCIKAANGTLETPVWGKPAKRGALLGYQREVTTAETKQQILTVQ